MLYCHFGVTSSEGFLCLFIGLVCFLLLFNYKNSACLLKQFQQKRMGHTCVYRYMYGIHVSHRHVCTQWLCSLFFKNNHCPLLELCSINNFDMKEKIGINLRFIPLSNILSISQALPLPSVPVATLAVQATILSDYPAVGPSLLLPWPSSLFLLVRVLF